MTQMPVSVVVVSRGRPQALTRCLTGLAQQTHPNFEIVVVADPEGISAAKALPFSDPLKLVPFDLPNISAARNAGIAQAAGEVVAFIDDDAVPEPTWLHYLTAPADQGVAAMGGFVRGRNGISFQWRARVLDWTGHSEPLEVASDRATVLTPPRGRAVKTEGTNMALRRDVLVRLGGFDPAFHFYLDETDLNLRVALARLSTAIVPMAEVHHRFAASGQRRADRVPSDLFDIGASWAVFQRKYMTSDTRPGHWAVIRRHERGRVMGHMVGGTLEPAAVRRLMARLDAGYAQGLKRQITPARIAAHAQSAFRPFPSAERKSVLLSGSPFARRRLQGEAAARVKAGEAVTLMIFSLTALYHRVSFHPDGYWLHTGGVFGRSTRGGSLWRWARRAGRVKSNVQGLGCRAVLWLDNAYWARSCAKSHKNDVF